MEWVSEAFTRDWQVSLRMDITNILAAQKPWMKRNQWSIRPWTDKSECRPLRFGQKWRDLLKYRSSCRNDVHVLLYTKDTQTLSHVTANFVWFSLMPYIVGCFCAVIMCCMLLPVIARVALTRHDATNLRCQGKGVYTTTVASCFSRSVARLRGHRATKSYGVHHWLGKTRGRVATIGPERRACTIEASDPKKE